MALLKGAFVRYDNDLLGALPVIVVFQFNPDTISRAVALAPLKSTTPPTKEEPLRVASEPAESMSFELQIDATDQLAAGSPLAAASGILPTLCALEMLTVAKESLNLASLSGQASFTTPPKSVPLVLFFWGPFRIVPVRFTSLNIDETLFDTRLNPIRAKVRVAFNVLTPNLLPSKEIGKGPSKIGTGAYNYTQNVKLVMAALNTLNALEVGASPSLSLSI